MEAGTILGLIAGVLGIMGTIGGFITWLNAQSNKKIANSITAALSPLTYEIKTLNSHLEANSIEHKEFKEVLQEHEDSIHEHDKRITVLERFGGKE